MGEMKLLGHLKKMDMAFINPKTNTYKYGFHDDRLPAYAMRPGIDEKIVEEISAIKQEPEWMRDRKSVV